MANKEIIVKDNVDIVIYSAAVQAIVNKFLMMKTTIPLILEEQMLLQFSLITLLIM